MNILEQANEIVYKRADEHRKYGDHLDTMPATAEILSKVTGKNWTADDVYWFFIVTKLCREGISHKQDNILDAIGYLTMFNDYKEKELNK